MNKIKTFISMSLLLVSIISCEKSNDDVQPIDILIGKWQLIDLVNISDKEKYLGETLELKDDYQYVYKDKDGVIISQGSVIYGENKEYVQLSNGRYGVSEMRYHIIEITNEWLKLEEHYTLDNKDSYLEYHYERMK
ncbi:hypothetical protein [Carboxylicivirga marina]|uniref:Lipocalin-like domain-containing protein n=1 Tax=Carboxylicivirga marina TaxID=2800988 RepID=A0ABS1HQC6_9BACT|nr:hypothetical protein [Carboxylicivirga marina]MBK3519887.1 hypothetical protein [Carboxylicivirga marina]